MCNTINSKPRAAEGTTEAGEYYVLGCIVLPLSNRVAPHGSSLGEPLAEDTAVRWPQTPPRRPAPLTRTPQETIMDAHGLSAGFSSPTWPSVGTTRGSQACATGNIGLQTTRHRLATACPAARCFGTSRLQGACGVGGGTEWLGGRRSQLCGWVGGGTEWLDSHKVTATGGWGEGANGMDTPTETHSPASRSTRSSARDPSPPCVAPSVSSLPGLVHHAHHGPTPQVRTQFGRQRRGYELEVAAREQQCCELGPGHPMP